MAGKQVTELDALPSFTDASLLPVHNGAGLKKGLLSQLASYLGTKFSNPNLLINPDFEINQRGLSSYSAGTSRIYTVDRWGGTQFTATVGSNAITIQANKSGVAQFSQKLEKATEKGFTISVHVVSVTGTAKLKTTGVEGTLKAGWNYFTSASSTSEITLEIAQGGSLTIDKIKLEKGSIATSFVAPNLAEEFVKCQRYYYKFKVLKYGVIPPGKAWVDEIIAKPFRTNPTVKIDKTFNISTSSMENKIEKIGDMYVISVRSSSNSNAQSQYGLEALVSIDAEIY